MIHRTPSTDFVAERSTQDQNSAGPDAAAELSLDIATFFDVSLDMLCIRDLSGHFVKLNQAWEAVLGYPLHQLEGRPLLPLIHPADVETTAAHMARLDEQEPDGAVIDFVNRYRHADGSYRRLEWRARRSGQRVFAVARDVTARQAVEDEMAAAREAAEAASLAKSEFLANMSHEIRTPLNGIIGIAAALERTGLTEGQREMVGLIEQSGVTLERLVSDILDVSKVEAGQLDIEIHEMDLVTELDMIVDLVRGRAEAKGLEFVVERGETARGDFLGDSTRIKQILCNLLSNAVKFTETGRVRVGVGIQDDHPWAGTALLTLEVEDSGVGFGPEFAASMFQRFSQADGTITRRFGGTGLGLSICRSLVELMGGDIEARSEPGKGSLFRVTVPMSRIRSLEDYDARKVEVQAMPEAAESLPVTSDGPRVLLAEDHPVNQRVVQLILAGRVSALVTVGNGAEAVAAFERETFDVVLMDMQMPVMDGLAATRAIRALEQAGPGVPRTPLIMLSANAMTRHQQDSLAAGADMHLPKPITAALLLEGIDAALAAAAIPARAAG
ncbi:ATP-binding protein [Brevundimonas sp.]|uniref:ATP-binding protein n=1 Tax=Brevundimonas sp. TaxID=1871086 RepID=UPI002487763D|nr:ATP-binding protein [Brevundimonas sp.]MDI1282293.1 ATP-binding protein [Brevundimonas sp.]